MGHDNVAQKYQCIQKGNDIKICKPKRVVYKPEGGSLQRAKV